ncbi:MAG: (2Fe-2S) ferredoxin domain-containing protein [Chloroflexota bacterium]|nr:(2Fe-2S) ferredoxin domain-containing protein [Chloroflexota bacterium]
MSVVPVSCIGECDLGPVCRIVQQDRLHGKVTATRAPGFAARLARMIRASSLPGRKRRRRR